jgi:hypothetical protein
MDGGSMQNQPTEQQTSEVPSEDDQKPDLQGRAEEDPEDELNQFYAG